MNTEAVVKPSVFELLGQVINHLILNKKYVVGIRGLSRRCKLEVDCKARQVVKNYKLEDLVGLQFVSGCLCDEVIYDLFGLNILESIRRIPQR
jgi:hypothetical protein